MSLWVKETFTGESEKEDKDGNWNVNAVIFGESDVYESDIDDVGTLFRRLQKEYGRCRGKVYMDIDGTKRRSREIGWLFESIQKYEDAYRLPKGEQTYKRVVWVEVHDAPPTVTVEHHYHFLDRKENTNDHSNS